MLTLATLTVAFILVWLLVQRTRRIEAKQHDAEELAALDEDALHVENRHDHIDLSQLAFEWRIEVDGRVAETRGLKGINAAPSETTTVSLQLPQIDRSEERRVGKECRSRWSPYH